MESEQSLAASPDLTIEKEKSVVLGYQTKDGQYYLRVNGVIRRVTPPDEQGRCHIIPRVRMKKKHRLRIKHQKLLVTLA